MEEKLKKLIDASHEIVDTHDVNTAMLLFTAHTRVSANCCGDTQKIGRMIYSAAKANEGLAEIIISVANTLQEDKE
ncbi:MAG: hypothetical protein LBU42_00750 [Prevotellaceae bacterium]|jgi:hypothetical protein|nr:hypothetical protein [Prevotellaceae bacterium]